LIFLFSLNFNKNVSGSTKDQGDGVKAPKSCSESLGGVVGVYGRDERKKVGVEEEK
jgi:hypothetical protein